MRMFGDILFVILCVKIKVLFRSNNNVGNDQESVCGREIDKNFRSIPTFDHRTLLLYYLKYAHCLYGEILKTVGHLDLKFHQFVKSKYSRVGDMLKTLALPLGIRCKSLPCGQYTADPYHGLHSRGFRITCFHFV